MEMNERIKRKAEELFRIYGIRSVTMDEISLQLGISKKTLYQSFDDKSELVDEVTKDMLQASREMAVISMEKARDAVEEIFLAKESLNTFLSNMIPSILFDLERGYPKSYQRFQDFKYNFLYDLIVKNIEWGQQEGLYREEVNADVYSRLRLEMVSIPFDERIFPKTKYTLLSLQHQLLEFYVHSLVTAKGKKLLDKYSQEKRENQ